MSRAFIILLDSFGIGASADAVNFGDEGSDTFRHIAQWCAQGKADKEGVRQGPLKIPNLLRLGLNGAAQLSKGTFVDSLAQPNKIDGAYGFAVEISKGKDTPSGHWELAGVPVLFEWGYFREDPCFPESLLKEFVQLAKLPGVLGNIHASGTEIIKDLGEEHYKSGKPIVYTSADSVFQIAAHEQSFGLQRLYDICDIARKLVDPYQIGRVIARPFAGEPGNFARTGNRKDYSIPPPEPTLLDYMIEDGREVIAIGKVADIYAHRGISKTVKANGNMALIDTFLKEMKTAPDGSLVFVNLVDFDMVYGHRRDVMGYANALEEFDARIPEIENLLNKDDVVIITADHGCDPTWPGSDHTREHIPVIAFGPSVKPGSIGQRDTMADIGQSLAAHLKIRKLKFGKSFLN